MWVPTLISASVGSIGTQLIADWVHTGASKIDGLTALRASRSSPAPIGASSLPKLVSLRHQGILVVNTVNNVHILIQFA